MRKFRTEGELVDTNKMYMLVNGEYIPLKLRFKLDTHTKEVWMYPDKHPELSQKITWKEYNSALKIFELVEKIYTGNSLKEVKPEDVNGN